MPPSSPPPPNYFLSSSRLTIQPFPAAPSPQSAAFVSSRRRRADPQRRRHAPQPGRRPTGARIRSFPEPACRSRVCGAGWPGSGCLSAVSGSTPGVLEIRSSRSYRKAIGNTPLPVCGFRIRSSPGSETRRIGREFRRQNQESQGRRRAGPRRRRRARAVGGADAAVPGSRLP